MIQSAGFGDAISIFHFNGTNNLNGNSTKYGGGAIYEAINKSLMFNGTSHVLVGI